MTRHFIECRRDPTTVRHPRTTLVLGAADQLSLDGAVGHQLLAAKAELAVAAALARSAERDTAA